MFAESVAPSNKSLMFFIVRRNMTRCRIVAFRFADTDHFRRRFEGG